MSATVLLQGKIFRDPESRTSGKGNIFAMTTIRVGDGDCGAWWRVFAFSTEARDELLTLRAGDTIAVSGSFKAELYEKDGTPRVSLSVTADRLISAKKQKRGRQRAPDRRTSQGFDASRSVHAPPSFDDSVPF